MTLLRLRLGFLQGVEPGVSCVSVNYYRLKDKKPPQKTKNGQSDKV